MPTLRASLLTLLAVATLASSAAQSQESGARGRLAPSRGLAELPRSIPAVPRELATKGCTRSVKDGGNLQDVLAKAKGGDVVCLAAGGRYEGNFTLPGRADTGWVVVRTEFGGDVPFAAGQRVRPSQSGMLAKLVGEDTEASSSVLRTGSGARRWYLALLEITTDSSRPTGPTALITLGGGDARETEQLARELVLDRVYAHGWPEQTLRRCLALNSASTAIVDSWIDECHEKGADSQAIAGWNGPGPFLIENNTLAGAGENVMFGGSDPRTPGLTPADVVLRRNHIVTPIEWKGRWTKKNLVETKNVRRFLIEDNVLEGSWADGQDGWAVLLKSANQGGRCTWCISADVIVRRNLIRRVAAGINVNGQGGAKRNIDSTSRRIEVTENYVEQVAVPPYTGAGRLVMILTGTDGLIVSQNTLLSPPNGNLATSFLLGSRNQISAENLVFERNVLTRGRYSFSGCGGPKTMMTCLPGGRVSGNIFVGGPRPEDRVLTGFMAVGSEGIALGRAGVSRATIERATAGVVVPR